MNSVERVKAIRKERKIPISKLESDLGFSNGYIGQLRKGVFPADRLAKIASYLGITTDYLLTGEETKKAPTPEGEREIDDRKMKAAFLGRIFLTAARVCGICQKNKKSEIAIKNSALQLQIADEIADENPPPFLRAGLSYKALIFRITPLYTLGFAT